MRQASLPLGIGPSFAERDYIVTESNRAAYSQLIEAEIEGQLRLLGPKGSGKSHLAAIFSARHPHAEIVETIGMNEESLFHLLMRQRAHPLLLLAQDDWQPQLPDLSSRCGALPRIALLAPDDALFAAVLTKAFADRQLRLPAEVLTFLERRMERSLDVATRIAARIDAEAMEKNMTVTIRLVKRIIEGLENNRI